MYTIYMDKIYIPCQRFQLVKLMVRYFKMESVILGSITLIALTHFLLRLIYI